MVVTLDEADETTDKTGDADETVFLDFNDPTIHDEFDVSSTTYLTEDIVLTDGHRDSNDKIDGENHVTTTIPFIPGVANSKQNYIRYSSGKVSIQSRNGHYVIFGKQYKANRSSFDYFCLSKLHKTVRLHSLT